MEGVEEDGGVRLISQCVCQAGFVEEGSQDGDRGTYKAAFTQCWKK